MRSRRVWTDPDPATTTFVVVFCGSVTLLSLFEQFPDLPGALAAFAAAWWVIGLEDPDDRPTLHS